MELGMMGTDEFTLKISTQENLRQRLALAALRRGWSPEQEAHWRLQQSFGLEKSDLRNLLEALDMPQSIRLKHSSTKTDISRITSICSELDVGGLVLGATNCELNKGVLVALIVAGPLTIVVDSTTVNMAREARISEVETLFQRLEELDLLKNAQACTVRVPETSHMSPEQATQVISREGKPRPFNLGAYLRLLAGHSYFDETRFTLDHLKRERQAWEDAWKSNETEMP